MKLEQLLQTSILGLTGIAFLTGCGDKEQPIPRRLSVEELEKLQTQETPKEELEKYDKRFEASYQTNWKNVKAELYKEGIRPEIANAYDERFSAWAIEILQGKKPYFGRDYREKEQQLQPVNPTIANHYPERFNGRDVIELSLAHIPPETTNTYDKDFSTRSIIQLYNLGYHTGIEPNKYNPIFREDRDEKGAGVVALAQTKIIPAEANHYAEVFHYPENIIKAIKLKLHWLTAKAYHIKHLFEHEWYILELWKEGIEPIEANAYTGDLFQHQNNYQQRLEGMIQLHQAKIDPIESNKYGFINSSYGTRIDPADIIFFKKEGKTYQDILEEVKKLAIEQRITR